MKNKTLVPHSKVLIAKFNIDNIKNGTNKNLDFDLYMKYRRGQLTNEDKDLWINELQENLKALSELNDFLENEINKINPKMYDITELNEFVFKGK